MEPHFVKLKPIRTNGPRTPVTFGDSSRASLFAVLTSRGSTPSPPGSSIAAADGSRFSTPRSPGPVRARIDLKRERAFLLALLMYTAAMYTSLHLAFGQVGAGLWEQGADPRRLAGLVPSSWEPAAVASSSGHRKLLMAADGSLNPAEPPQLLGSHPEDDPQPLLQRAPVLIPPELSSLESQSLNISAPLPGLLSSRVDALLSQDSLRNKHERYSCGGSPALPLKQSDEVLVVLRHLALLDSLRNEGKLGAVLNCTTCAVVGGSGSLAGGREGSTIDAHSCVFRVGDAPTAGFEADVGSKTTVRMHSAHSTEAWGPSSWLEPQDQTLLLGVRTVEHLRAVVAEAAAKRMLGPGAAVAAGGPGGRGGGGPGPARYLLNPALWCWLHEWVQGKGRQPSAGFAAVLLATDACQGTVDLFGLDYDAARYSYYGSSARSEARRAEDYSAHPLPEELSIYRHLETIGAVKIHAPLLPGSRLFA